MRQLGVTFHAVADGVDAGHIGFHPVVDQNGPPLVLHTSGIQIERSGVRLSADGHQDFLSFKGDRLSVPLTVHPHTVLRLFEGPDRCGKMKFDAHLFHMSKSHLGQIPVQHRQYVIHGLHYFHLCAESGIGAGQFHADDAAAHNNHGLRQFLQGQGPGGIDTVRILRQSRNRRCRIH